MHRLASPVLLNFPWYTTALSECDDLTKLPGMVSFQNFLEHLQQYESRLFNLGGSSQSMMDMQQSLGLNLLSMTELTPPLKLSSRNGTKLCGLICAYRLLDVIAWVKGTSALASYASSNPLTGSIKLIYGMDKLANWPDVLSGFRVIMHKVNIPNTNRLSNESNTAPFRLLRMISRNEWSKTYQNIEGNFLVAAMHVACMKEFKFARDSYPDIPGILVEGMPHVPVPLSTQEREDLHDLSSLTATIAGQLKHPMEGLTFLRAPLQLSLLISPIYLLIPGQLMKRNYNRLTMLSINKLLGNGKPQSIIDVEKAIWDVVFSLAEGRLDPAHLLHRLCRDLPWDKIMAAEQDECRWFDLNRCISVPHPPVIGQEVQLNDGRQSLTVQVMDHANESLQASESYARRRLSLGNEPMGLGEDPDAEPIDNKGIEGTHVRVCVDEGVVNVEYGKVPPSGCNDVPFCQNTLETSLAASLNACFDSTQYSSQGGIHPLALVSSQTHQDSPLLSHPSSRKSVTVNPSDLQEATPEVVVTTDAPVQRPPVDAMDVDNTESTSTKRRQSLPVPPPPEQVFHSSEMEVDPETISGRNPAHNAEGPSVTPIRPRRRPKARKVIHEESHSKPGVKKSPSRVEQYKQIGSGSYLEPIDLGAYLAERTITFEPKLNPHRITGPMCQFFSPNGDVKSWLPEFHFESDLSSFQTFEKLVRSSYGADGKPLHCAKQDISSFAILSDAEYSAKSTLEIQTLFRDKHIIVTDMTPDSTIRFDAAGLRHLTNLDAKIHLQDQSIDVTDGYYPRQVVVGTPKQLLDASCSASGPILNALSFPLGLSGVKPSSISSDVEAWRMTEGMIFCPSEGSSRAEFPVSEMRWGLAATRGARHWIHIDSDGLGTFIDVKCGGKWWVVFSPPTKLGKHGFGAIDTFLNNFNIDGENKGRFGDQVDDERWIAEGIYLSEGTRFLMRPNTPHMVITTDHSIVIGGHFYSTSNLQHTFYGIVHCFMGNGLMTNTDHGKTRMLLIRMMQYFYKCLVSGVDDDEYSDGHLPNLLDSQSFVDVLTLCNFCILVNVLDFQTYSFRGLSDQEKPSPRDFEQRVRWDYNAVSILNREYYTYARGLAHNFISWLASNYDVTYAHSNEPVPDLEKDFCRKYLTDQACAMLAYKTQAEEESFHGLEYCSQGDLDRQMGYLFEDDENDWFGDWSLKKANLDNYRTLSFGSMAFTVTKKDSPLKYACPDPSLIGKSVGDRLYKEGLSKGFPSLKSTIRPKISHSDDDDSNDGTSTDAGMSTDDDSDDYRPNVKKTTLGKRRRN